MARKLVFDRLLFAAVLVLTGLGLVMVYSSSAAFARERLPFNPYFMKQALAAAVGLAAMGVAMHIDYRWLRRRWVIYSIVLGALAFLAAALFADNDRIGCTPLRLDPRDRDDRELADLRVLLLITRLPEPAEGIIDIPGRVSVEAQIVMRQHAEAGRLSRLEQ